MCLYSEVQFSPFTDCIGVKPGYFAWPTPWLMLSESWGMAKSSSEIKHSNLGTWITPRFVITHPPETACSWSRVSSILVIGLPLVKHNITAFNEPSNDHKHLQLSSWSRVRAVDKKKPAQLSGISDYVLNQYSTPGRGPDSPGGWCTPTTPLKIIVPTTLPANLTTSSA